MNKQGEARENRTVMLCVTDANMLRVVADHRECTIADAAAKYLRASLVREYKRCLHEMQAELGGES